MVAVLDVLQTGDFETRWEAAKQLEDYGEAIISPLLTMLQQSDPDVELQWFIAKILGTLNHPDVVFALTQLLEQSEDEEVQSIAAQGLAKLGPEAIDSLSKSLQDPLRQRMALQALTQIHKPEVVPLLLDMVDADSAQVRSLAFEALDQFLDPRIVDALLVGLNDASPEVRKIAIASLAVRTQEYPREELVRVLIPFLEDSDLGVVIQSTRALGRLGTDPGADSGCAAIALIQKCRAPNLEPELQKNLIQALGWIASPVAQAGLKEIWQHLEQQTPLPELLLQEVLSSVANDVGLADWLVGVMRSPTLQQSPTLRAKAMLTLGRIGSPALIPLLIKYFEDSDFTVRLHVVAALKQIDPELAHAAMEQRLKEANIEPRLAQGLAIALREW